MKPYVKFFERIEKDPPKYWLDPDDNLIEVNKYESHEDYLSYGDEDSKNYDKVLKEALKDGWIRILGQNHILYFNCYNYSNKIFSRIYKLLQRNKDLANYSMDIEVIDDKDGKRYKYYGNKLAPRK